MGKDKAVKDGFRSCLVLMNPSRKPSWVKKFKRQVRQLYKPEIIESQSKEDFIQRVKGFYDSDYQHLLVWGGDGTAHDAINALMESKESSGGNTDKAVGFLRGGSGNGIQDSYEVPFSLHGQIKVYESSMRHGYVQKVDLLKIRTGGQTVYGQLLGCGFDAYVLEKRNRAKMKNPGGVGKIVTPGFFNYILSGLSTLLFEYNNIHADYQIDLENGKYAFRGTRVNAEYPITKMTRTVRLPMIELGTRPYYGKLFKVCPDVVCNDGYIDVYLFNFENKFEIIKNFTALWNGKHHKINKRLAKRKKPVIERYEVKKIRLSSKTPFYFHIDGELFTAEKGEGCYFVEVEIVPQAISFVVPPTFYRKFQPVEFELEPGCEPDSF